jgi:nitrogen fixation NifU-like protein
MNPYGDVIQDHFRHPRNYGSLDGPDIRHEGVNPFCGDRVRIELSLGEHDTIRAVMFQGDLCMISKAAASLLTGMIHGLTLENAEQLPEQELLDALQAEILPARLNCARLPLQVLQTGIQAYRKDG